MATRTRLRPSPSGFGRNRPANPCRSRFSATRRWRLPILVGMNPDLQGDGFEIRPRVGQRGTGARAPVPGRPGYFGHRPNASTMASQPTHASPLAGSIVSPPAAMGSEKLPSGRGKARQGLEYGRFPGRRGPEWALSRRPGRSANHRGESASGVPAMVRPAPEPTFRYPTCGLQKHIATYRRSPQGGRRPHCGFKPRPQGSGIRTDRRRRAGSAAGSRQNCAAPGSRSRAHREPAAPRSWP